MLGSSPRPRSRWTVLTYGTAAGVAASLYLYGLPFLAPYLHSSDHLSLPTIGFIVAAPALGLIGTLIAWGAAADRWGERPIISVGLALTAVFAAVASVLHSPAALFVAFALGGGAGGSVSAASGRLIMGSFDVSERGIAMAIRQTGQPLGVAAAALALPPAATVSLRLAILVPAVACGVLAVLVWAFTVDPPRRQHEAAKERPPSPYRQAALWRVHACGTLLVIPQFAVSAFGEEFLVSERHWGSGPAGRLLAIVGIAGAFGRVATGIWSDRVNSRLRPMRLVAVASAAAMLAVGLTAGGHSAIILVALALASIISVADNGLGFVATAELAGPAWAGRALGAQNTGQNVAAFLTPPLFAALVVSSSYSTAFLACAVFPALGILTVPVKAEAPQEEFR